MTAQAIIVPAHCMTRLAEEALKRWPTSSNPQWEETRKQKRAAFIIGGEFALIEFHTSNE